MECPEYAFLSFVLAIFNFSEFIASVLRFADLFLLRKKVTPISNHHFSSETGIPIRV